MKQSPRIPTAIVWLALVAALAIINSPLHPGPFVRALPAPLGPDDAPPAAASDSQSPGAVGAKPGNDGPPSTSDGAKSPLADTPLASGVGSDSDPTSASDKDKAASSSSDGSSLKDPLSTAGDKADGAMPLSEAPKGSESPSLDKASSSDPSKPLGKDASSGTSLTSSLDDGAPKAGISGSIDAPTSLSGMSDKASPLPDGPSKMADQSKLGGSDTAASDLSSVKAMSKIDATSPTSLPKDKSDSSSASKDDPFSKSDSSFKSLSSSGSPPYGSSEKSPFSLGASKEASKNAPPPSYSPASGAGKSESCTAGHMRCAASGGFQTCVHGSWNAAMACAAGTKCKPNGTSIICDFA